MTGDHDLGGDPPCWAHLLDEADGPGEPTAPVVVDVDRVGAAAGGVVWSLPHGGDLDANLVRLGSGDGIAEHRNHDLDVLIVVRSGSGQLSIDDRAHPLGAGVVALVPRGTRRSLSAGPSGITYLSVHRRRGPLTISGRPDDEELRRRPREGGAP